MATTTYSFEDVTVTISHPAVGQYVASGQGIGNISVTMANDRTTHDVSADGSVMVSKVRARNGQIALTIQQTSALHAWLTKWFNYLEASGADAWADRILTLRAPKMKQIKTAIGVTPQKQSDVPYAAQGQSVSWNLMAADIQQDAA